MKINNPKSRIQNTNPIFARLLACTLTLVSLCGLQVNGNEPLALSDGDRVALIGNTLIERMGRYGYLELTITTQFPDDKIIFRNLGWSGDNVFLRSRDYFDKPGDGYQRIMKQVDEIIPTVIFLAYGSNEAFELGKSGIPTFKKGYTKLINDLLKVTPNIILLGPLAQEKLRGLPDPTAHNSVLKKYNKAIAEIAHDSNIRFIDLFETPDKSSNWTYNSIHLHDEGYRELAKEVCRQLGLSANTNFDGKKNQALLEIIRKKNKLFFYGSRPQNETYLLGHRKHEQGQNAAEIKEFAPLVANKDREINQRKR